MRAIFSYFHTIYAGIDQDSHKTYLEDFCEKFHDDIVEMIDSAVEQSQKLSSDAVYSEALQHLHACSNSCKIFQVRAHLLLLRLLTSSSAIQFLFHLYVYVFCFQLIKST